MKRKPTSKLDEEKINYISRIRREAASKSAIVRRANSKPSNSTSVGVRNSDAARLREIADDYNITIKDAVQVVIDYYTDQANG